MTADARNRDEGAGGPFGRIDPKLTIFALANGMDLAKDEGVRRLEWYRDGHERGILLAAGADGRISVTAQAWKRGDDASLQRTPMAEDLSLDALTPQLTALLERGLEAANAL
jgi:hypothetical protein